MGQKKEYPSFGVYKGLQKPLEFMGLQGRYIVWGAGCALSSFILFAVFFALFGVGWAMLALVLYLGCGISFIAYKQQKGLHDKKKMEGIHIITNLFKIK